MSPRTRIILDTDIGDDIDDALALGLILASPELELVGVTTVFGNTAARARQARTVLAVAGRADVPVAAGCGGTMTTRPVEHGGTRAYLEGHLPNQDAACWPEERLPALDRRHGVDFLVETIMAGAGDIVPVTIGAMTNLAMALVKEPRIAARIPRIVAMAGEVRTPMAEWNIRCDPEAAAIVMRSGIRVELTPFWIGQVAMFTEADIDRLRAATTPLPQLLARTIAEWRKGWGRMPCLFDPLAVATMIRPDLCTWRTGRVDVELQGQATFACTPFVQDKEGAAPGPHRVAWDVDRDRAIDFFLSRVLAHGAAAARA